MSKFWKIFQYGYLIIALIFFIEGIIRWNLEREKAYIWFSFGFFITLVFFFKRNFRKKIEKRNTQN